MRIFVFLGIALIAVSFFSGQAQAQSQNQGWRHQPYLVDGIFFETLSAMDGKASFVCAGYYPPADPIQLEGDGITQPYTIELRFSGNQVISEGQGGEWYLRRDIAIVSGGKGFRVPEFMYNEMIGEWQAILPFSDPLILEILNNGGFRAQNQTTVLARFPDTGLALGLASVLRACDAHWGRLGHRIPQGQVGFINALRAGIAPPVVSQHAPVPQPEGAVMRALVSEANRVCQSRALIGPHTILQSDFDGDGRRDLVLDWSGVSCQSGPMSSLYGGGQCGASQCSKLVFISSRVAKGLPAIDFLGQGVVLDPAKPSDLLVGIGLSDCHYQGLEPTCLLRWRWNGTDFAIAPR